MKEKISQLIEYEVENSTLDFKQEEYSVGKKHPKRNEILKDLSSFANHPSDQDKFIIIGVIEKGGRAEGFQNLPETTDEATYQQIVNSNIEPKLNFEYKTVLYKSYRLAYFRLHKNTDRPYLFKKQLINPKTQKIDFNEGDGFIRMGTSTRKILRQDFDNIYQEKWKSKDRKTDIEIEFFSSREDEEFPFLPFLDMHISNFSNKSISMDVEMEIQKNDLYNVITRAEIRKLIQQMENNQSSFGLGHIPMEIPSLDVSVEEKEDKYIVSRNAFKKEFPITLYQHQKEEFIFSQYIFFDKEDSQEVSIKVTIRSDDFVDGPIIQEYNIHT